jgi:DNA-binding MarR family transcriptional regulator
MDSQGTLKPVKSQFKDGEYRDVAEFRCALRAFLSYSEQQARASNITPQQYLLLLVVRGHKSMPNVSIGEIAEALQVRHHSASLLVDRCVKRGFVQRREDPSDRRRALVSVTQEGQDLLDHVMVANRKQMGRLEEALFRDSLREALREYSAARERERAS